MHYNNLRNLNAFSYLSMSLFVARCLSLSDQTKQIMALTLNGCLKSWSNFKQIVYAPNYIHNTEVYMSSQFAKITKNILFSHSKQKKQIQFTLISHIWKQFAACISHEILSIQRTKKISAVF